MELPTNEEDARINAGIAADHENPELDEAWFARARPASQVLPPQVYGELVALRRSRGERGPQKAPTTIRLSPEVSAAFRACNSPPALMAWATLLSARMQTPFAQCGPCALRRGPGVPGRTSHQRQRCGRA